MTAFSRIAVFGDVLLDRYLFGAPHKISAEAPIPVMRITHETTLPGGAANVAANIASLGAEPILVGVVGEDSGGYCLKNALEACAVSSNWLQVDSRWKTPIKTRLMAGASQVARYDIEAPHTLKSGTNSAAVAAALVDAGAVVLSDYDKGFCAPELCQTLITQAKNLNIPVLVDPKACFQKYRGATVITPNKKEAETELRCVIDTIDAAKTAAVVIRKKYRIKTCILTLGAQGLVVATSKNVVHIPTAAQAVFDVTGAGDTVIAALAVRLMAGSDLLAACNYANAAAAAQVSHIGTGQITAADVVNFLSTANNEKRAVDKKLIPSAQLPQLLSKLRASAAQIGFTNGCFDIFHAGHAALLNSAKELCDVLIVGVNSDSAVSRLKGADRPYNCLAARTQVLSALSAVTYIVEFSDDTPLELIKTIKPDILIKGQDYEHKAIIGAEFVVAYGGKVHLVPLVPDVSTTALSQKIIDTLV